MYSFEAPCNVMHTAEALVVCTLLKPPVLLCTLQKLPAAVYTLTNPPMMVSTVLLPPVAVCTLEFLNKAQRGCLIH